MSHGVHCTASDAPWPKPRKFSLVLRAPINALTSYSVFPLPRHASNTPLPRSRAAGLQCLLRSDRKGLTRAQIVRGEWLALCEDWGGQARAWRGLSHPLAAASGACLLPADV